MPDHFTNPKWPAARDYIDRCGAVPESELVRDVAGLFRVDSFVARSWVNWARLRRHWPFGPDIGPTIAEVWQAENAQRIKNGLRGALSIKNNRDDVR